MTLQHEKKIAILQAYAGNGLPEEPDELSEAFHTPYELSLAAECLAEGRAVACRAALFDVYTRRRCEQTTNAAITRAVLCAIATRMRRRLVSSLPLGEVRRLADAPLKQEGGRMALLPEALACGFVDVRPGRCALRHEPLGGFLAAPSLPQE